MTYSPDKIPTLVKAYRNLSPFRQDMSIRIAIGGPQEKVIIFALFLFDLDSHHHCSLFEYLGFA
jgi:hypothetical protein